MATALNSENYNLLNNTIIEVIKSGKRALISIYTDANASTPATDSRGPIINREVLSASYTASYKDDEGNMTNPFVVVKFREGEFIDYFTSVDYVEDHWFSLSSTNIPAMKF
jgi:hypothetical protein